MGESIIHTSFPKKNILLIFYESVKMISDPGTISAYKNILFAFTDYKLSVHVKLTLPLKSDTISY